MDKLNYTDKAALEIVKNFCSYFVDLKAKLYIYKELFENDKAKLIMESTAKSFFLEINQIIVNTLLLEFAKISDRGYDNGVKRENFTVENLIDSINWPENIKERLEELKKKAGFFHSLIKKARNRLLAHYDKEAFLSDKALGEFTPEQEVEFIETLQEICDIIHQACFGSIVGDIVMSMPGQGDVQDLKKALKKAIAYDRFFSEGNTEEKTKLLKFLHGIE
ncbi:MAG: hypothetical protein GX075_10530 [Firmicutes bacterium]|nr:hypothetical protein [Bacillota bacterium]